MSNNAYVEQTLKMIEDEINYILNNDVYYKPYRGKVTISDEQTFAKKSELTPEHIYIVTKFTNTSLDFGQALLPVTINAVSEQNSLVVCQKLLFELATNYTQQAPIASAGFSTDDYVKQIWNTPNVINNFNEISYGFRSLFYMTGTIIVGKNSDPIEQLICYVDGNTTNTQPSNVANLHEYMITFSDSFDVYPDTQAFYSTNGIGKTAAKTASYAFNITLFKIKSPSSEQSGTGMGNFMRKCKNIKRGNVTAQPNGISTKFKIAIKEKDDATAFVADYTLVNMTIQQNKGDLPTVSLSFAR